MDNFFQILFFLFIIFSFLAPLFKKKQEDQRRRTQPPDENTSSSGSKPAYSQRNENNDYDILREIEGMFNKTSDVNIPGESEVNLKKEKTHYETSEWHDKTSTENTVDEEWHRPTTEANFKRLPAEGSPQAGETALIEEEAKRFEQMLNEKKEEVNRIRKKIIETIKNPRSLKEYFVISEILGAPKGFE